MKFTLITLVSAALAVSALSTEDKKIAARQVDTKTLRAGTRRLRARQSTASPGVGLQENRYLNCGQVFPPYVLDDVQVVKTADLTSQDENRAICSYVNPNDSTDTFSCRYETATGFLDQPVVGACSTTIGQGTQTGACYTACRRQLTTGEFFSGNDLEVSSPIGGIINCQYATTQTQAEAGETQFLCQYSITDGSFIQGSTINNCPSAIPASNFCLSTYPAQ